MGGWGVGWGGGRAERCARRAALAARTCAHTPARGGAPACPPDIIDLFLQAGGGVHEGLVLVYRLLPLARLAGDLLAQQQVLPLAVLQQREQLGAVGAGYHPGRNERFRGDDLDHDLTPFEGGSFS